MSAAGPSTASHADGLREIRRPGPFGLRRTARAHPGLARACERAWGPDWLLDPLAALARTPSATRLADRRNRTLWWVEKLFPDEQGGGALYVKHQRYPLPGRLFTWVFGPWGRRELDALRAVRALGVAAVEPVLGVVIARGPFVHETLLATRALPDAVDLSAWWRNRGGDAHERVPPDELRRALPRLFAMLARLHRAGFALRTAGAKNVLVHRDASGALAFTLLDLPRARYRPGRPVRLRLAVYDLACLDRWAVRWLDAPTRRGLLRAWRDALVAGSARAPSLDVLERRVARRRARLLRETPGSYALHRGRRRLKSLPGIGHWFR